MILHRPILRLNRDRKGPAAIKKHATQQATMLNIPPEGAIIDPKYKWMYEQDLHEMVEKATVKTETGTRKLLKENRKIIYDFIKDARMGKTIKKNEPKKRSEEQDS